MKYRRRAAQALWNDVVGAFGEEETLTIPTN